MSMQLHDAHAAAPAARTPGTLDRRTFLRTGPARRHPPACGRSRTRRCAWSCTPAPAAPTWSAAVRDPNQPTRVHPAYDSGDHLHPNDAGYAALAQAVPLSFFAH